MSHSHSSPQIVILSHRHLGDTLFTEPIIRALSHHKPTLIVKSQAAHKIATHFFKSPNIAICTDFKFLKGFLRANKPDIFVALDRALGSAITAWRAPVPVRVGQAWEGRGFFLTHPVNIFRKEHHLDGHLRVLAELSKILQEPLQTDGFPKLNPPLISSFPSSFSYRQDAYIVLHTNTTRPSKEFSLETYLNILSQLRKKGFKTVITGTDARYSKWLEGKASEDLIGRLNFEQLAHILAKAKAVISPDTGPMHLAAAYGVPTLGIFGSTSPHLTGPRGHKCLISSSNATCSPCYKVNCRYSDHRYLCCYKKDVPQLMQELLKMVI